MLILFFSSFQLFFSLCIKSSCTETTVFYFLNNNPLEHKKQDEWMSKEIMRLLDESATIYFVAMRSQIRALNIVKSSGQLFDKIVDTKRLFLGVMIGDFSRTGISTMINTGSYFGLGANIFGNGFLAAFF